MLNSVTSLVIGVELLLFLGWLLHRPRSPREMAGGALVAGSLVLLLLARRSLGRSFAVRAKAKRLVTTGVYARVRHPIYVAGGLLVVGLAVLFAHWWVLLLLLVLVPVQAWRARRETAVLRARFGAEYERYRRQTWF